MFTSVSKLPEKSPVAQEKSLHMLLVSFGRLKKKKLQKGIEKLPVLAGIVVKLASVPWLFML